MDEYTRIQLVAEVVLEFQTQLKNDFEVDKIGSMVLEIVQSFQDLKLYEIVREAYEKREEPKEAILLLKDALAYLHKKLDGLEQIH